MTALHFFSCFLPAFERRPEISERLMWISKEPVSLMLALCDCGLWIPDTPRNEDARLPRGWDPVGMDNADPSAPGCTAGAGAQGGPRGRGAAARCVAFPLCKADPCRRLHPGSGLSFILPFPPSALQGNDPSPPALCSFLQKTLLGRPRERPWEGKGLLFSLDTAGKYNSNFLG